jgi:hypothetical protein
VAAIAGGAGFGGLGVAELLVGEVLEAGGFWSFPSGWLLVVEAPGFGGGAGLGAFLSVVARFRTSTFSPSLS